MQGREKSNQNKNDGDTHFQTSLPLSQADIDKSVTATSYSSSQKAKRVRFDNGQPIADHTLSAANDYLSKSQTNDANHAPALPIRKAMASEEIEELPESMEHLKREGTLIGSGQNGDVYKYQGFAYKIPNIDRGINSPERTSMLWNAYFSPKMPGLPRAKVIKLSSQSVLKTPFIEGRKMDCQNPDDLAIIKSELREYTKMTNRYIADWDVEGNILLTPEHGPLIIDFDAAVSLSTPASPMSLAMQTYYGINSKFIKTYKYKNLAVSHQCMNDFDDANPVRDQVIGNASVKKTDYVSIDTLACLHKSSDVSPHSVAGLKTTSSRKHSKEKILGAEYGKTARQDNKDLQPPPQPINAVQSEDPRQVAQEKSERSVQDLRKKALAVAARNKHRTATVMLDSQPAATETNGRKEKEKQPASYAQP